MASLGPQSPQSVQSSGYPAPKRAADPMRARVQAALAVNFSGGSLPASPAPERNQSGDSSYSSMPASLAGTGDSSGVPTPQLPDGEGYDTVPGLQQREGRDPQYAGVDEALAGRSATPASPSASGYEDFSALQDLSVLQDLQEIYGCPLDKLPLKERFDNARAYSKERTDVSFKVALGFFVDLEAELPAMNHMRENCVADGVDLPTRKTAGVDLPTRKTAAQLFDAQFLGEDQLETLENLCRAFDWMTPNEIFGAKKAQFVTQNWVTALERIEAAKRQDSLVLSGLDLCFLPVELYGCTGLELLNLRGNSLTSLPDELEALGRLTDLFLQENKLAEFPAVICTFVELQKLDVSKNNIATSLPDGIKKLSALEELNLSHNALVELPNNFGCLVALTTLNISHNKIEDMLFLKEFTGASVLPALTKLDLSRNQLSEVRQEFDRLSALKVLVLTRNNIQSFLPSLPQLQKLDLKQNQLKAFPDTIVASIALQELSLEANKIQSLPETVKQLTQLKHLNLNSNQFPALPKALGKLVNLTILTARDNKLEALPKELKALVALTELDVANNQLTRLPDLSSMTKLSKFYLGYNRFTAVPNTVWMLTTLTVLSLTGNPLSGALPDKLLQLTALEKLFVNNTGIDHLPKGMRRLERLQSLNAAENKHLSHAGNVHRAKQLVQLDLEGCDLKSKYVSTIGEWQAAKPERELFISRALRKEIKGRKSADHSAAAGHRSAAPRRRKKA